MNAIKRAAERGAGLKIAAQFIAEFEGGQSPDGLFHPYWDDNGNVWTIGYGHTSGVGRSTKPMTKKQALALLKKDLAKTYGPAIDALKLPLKRHMYAATVSAVYNLGAGILDEGRSFGTPLRQQQWRKAADALLVYVKDANGKVLLGLQRRRGAERDLFLKDV